jgi:hypothetical protein
MPKLWKEQRTWCFIWHLMLRKYRWIMQLVFTGTLRQYIECVEVLSFLLYTQVKQINHCMDIQWQNDYIINSAIEVLQWANCRYHLWKEHASQVIIQNKWLLVGKNSFQIYKLNIKLIKEVLYSTGSSYSTSWRYNLGFNKESQKQVKICWK